MFQTTFISALLVLLLGNGSCAPDVKENAPSSPHISAVTQNIPADTLITLERGACYGECPIYKLEIFADGRIIYEGKEFVRIKGRIEDKISQEHLRELMSEFEHANYFSLKDKYWTAEDGCTANWSDASSVTTSIRVGGGTKSIFHYLGCQVKSSNNSLDEIFPPELTRLERRIDEIAGTKRWIK